MLIGFVGKPSVGKSTMFKACTLADVAIASYPFTTIKPNRAVGFVKIDCVDKEFNKQCNPRMGYCVNHNRFVPVELLDVAGLVPGASEGAGLGNQFLSDLATADVLIHVVDASGSTNEKGENVKPLSYDPINDIKFLEDEIDKWMYGIIKKGWDKFVRQQLLEFGVTEYIADNVLRRLNEDVGKWNDVDVFNFIREIRKETKPIIIA